VYTINLNLNIFVPFINSETRKQLRFLVVTRANISLLKENADVFNNLQLKNTINIQGIGEGIIKSKGIAPIEL